MDDLNLELMNFSMADVEWLKGIGFNDSDLVSLYHEQTSITAD